MNEEEFKKLHDSVRAVVDEVVAKIAKTESGTTKLGLIEEVYKAMEDKKILTSSKTTFIAGAFANDIVSDFLKDNKNISTIVEAIKNISATIDVPLPDCGNPLCVLHGNKSGRKVAES